MLLKATFNVAKSDVYHMLLCFAGAGTQFQKKKGISAFSLLLPDIISVEI